MRTQVKIATLENHKQGRNVILGVYVILSTFLITSYTLVQYFAM